MNGSIAGSGDGNDGGRLGGNGTVGAATIASGGTVAPGNSIGTLVVAGDVNFAAGSIYEVELTPAESDLIRASGVATIAGGTVHALPAAGVYVPDSRLTILEATGGVTGTFDALTEDAPFVDLSLSYDATHAYLGVARNEVAFCDVTQTPNQCASADGAESLGAGNAVFDAIAALPDAASARLAFDLLSGEVHASAKGVLLDDSRYLREAVEARIRAARGEIATVAMPLLAYGEGGAEPAAADTERFAAWGQAIGAWGEIDGDGNAAEIDRSAGGLLLGVDAAVADNWRVGLVTGYSRTSFDVDDRASSGDSDDVHLGVYGGGRWGAWGVSAGAAYTWHAIETQRAVVFPGFAETLSADDDAGTAQIFGEAGYKIERGSYAFEPFANLAYVSLDSDAFTESGGAAALSSAGTTTDVTYTTLGLRASSEVPLGSAHATVEGMLGWRHAFGDVTPLSTFAFAGGDAFEIAGAPIAEDAFALSAGLDVDIAANATLGASYSGQIASDAQDHAFKIDLTVTF